MFRIKIGVNCKMQGFEVFNQIPAFYLIPSKEIIIFTIKAACL